MPILDSQARLIIPASFRQLFGLNLSDEVAICYNFSNDTVTLCNKQNIANNCVLALKKFDSKGRLILPKDVLSLLGVNKGDLILIFVQDNKLRIKGMGGTGT